MDPSHDCILWMSQTDFRTQTKHLRFPGLIQWGHLRQAFQGLFHPWEDLVVLKGPKVLCGGSLSFTQVLAHLWTGPARFLASQRTVSVGT